MFDAFLESRIFVGQFDQLTGHTLPGQLQVHDVRLQLTNLAVLKGNWEMNEVKEVVERGRKR